MMVCAYCGNPAPESPIQSCCGEIHFEDIPECPECGELPERAHHHADSLAPECDYWLCECGHQFNHG